MNEEKYNGYANRESWLVSLWLANEDPLYRHAVSLAEDEDETGIQEYVTDMMTSGLDGMRLDMMNAALSRVDWREVYEAFKDE